MADGALFDVVARELEWRTDFDKLEARGTVRLALKQAGLQPGAVTREQMAIVLDRVLPEELATRGVSDAAAVCGAIARALAALKLDSDAPAGDTPEAVFDRMSGGGAKGD